ncbi:DNA primase [Xanthomonas phage SB3]|uniref:DNA primase n=1 Tax=Xanthomonas phage SB3 TaxID=3117472 RepID=A0ABZ2GUG4_9CAUD
MAEWMPPEEWLATAQRLLVGRKSARMQHHCGVDDSIMLTSEGGVLSAYCHRCDTFGRYQEQESTADMLARLAAEKEATDLVRQSVELPEPRVYTLSEWPKADALWFYKMGLSPQKIAQLGLYWCPKIGRVVLPITVDGRVVFWTARSQTRSPKWLGPRVDKVGLVARYGQGNLIVLCEDPLSAFKIGLVTEAWSLLGTKLRPSTAMELARDGRPVVVWLDDDKGRKNLKNPGQDSAAKIRQQLGVLGVETRNVTSDRDPKYYEPEYIKEKLGVID